MVRSMGCERHNKGSGHTITQIDFVLAALLLLNVCIQFSLLQPETRAGQVQQGSCWDRHTAAPHNVSAMSVCLSVCLGSALTHCQKRK